MDEIQIQLTITPSASLPAEVLSAFIAKAVSEGKRPEQKLADLITKESAAPKP